MADTKVADNTSSHRKTTRDWKDGFIHFGEATHDHKTKDTIYVHTGNIANWNNFKSRKANELHRSLTRTLGNHLQEKGSLSNKEVYINF